MIRELADGLVARGHEPRLITSHPGPPSRAVEDGLPIVRNWRPPAGRLKRRHIEDHLTHVPFSYLSLSGTDDLAHAFYPTDALAAARWSRRSGRPAVLTYLGIPDRASLVHRRWRTEITVRATNGCAAVVAVSRAARDAFRYWLGAEARTIYPGVDMTEFSPAPEERDEHPTIFCAADPSEPRKRIDLLLASFARLRRDRPTARLLLLRPSDPDRARAMAERPGVELVEPAASRLAPFYRRAWVSALPAFGEAFGLVLAEALACGTPGVGSSLGGIPEVLDRPEVGRVFAEDEAEAALTRALHETLELAGDPATAGACRERAAEFATGSSTDAYERLYRELVEGA